jgi:hypothetical protein
MNGTHVCCRGNSFEKVVDDHVKCILFAEKVHLRTWLPDGGRFLLCEQGHIAWIEERIRAGEGHG